MGIAADAEVNSNVADVGRSVGLGLLAEFDAHVGLRSG